MASKLKQAVRALAQISFLDLDKNASLDTAIEIASAALKAIEHDEARVIFHTDEDTKKFTVQIASAAGNSEMVTELAPLVTQLLDSVNEANGGTPFEWLPVETSP